MFCFTAKTIFIKNFSIINISFAVIEMFSQVLINAASIFSIIVYPDPTRPAGRPARAGFRPEQVSSLRNSFLDHSYDTSYRARVDLILNVDR